MSYIFLVIAVLWVAQFALAWWQLRRFHSRIAQLRTVGRTAVGLKGNRFSGRTYGVLAVDDDGIIQSAEAFDGWTVFSQLRPVAGLKGQPIQVLRVVEAPPGMRRARWEALQHAASFLEPKALQAPALTHQ